jgi:N-acetylglucosamine malate deacetylase 1
MIDVLAIVAHPDDAELLCGGALLRTARSGGSAAVLDLTRGEGGSYGSADVRARETEAASSILGLADRRNAALPDGSLENTSAARAIVAGQLRALRPGVVITHWPEARHPDHRVASELVRDACFLAGLRSAKVDGEAFRPGKLLYCLTYAEHAPKPTFVLDISDAMEGKLDAIGAYASQVQGKSALGDVFAGGGRPILDQIRAMHAHYGSWIRTAYGEPYWTRETVGVSDLRELGVNSF